MWLVRNMYYTHKLVLWAFSEQVELAGPSSKAARLISDRADHNLSGLLAGDSFKTYNINVKRHADPKTTSRDHG